MVQSWMSQETYNAAIFTFRRDAMFETRDEAAMDNPYTFDPQLPDLYIAIDREAVARLFEQRWPGLDGPPRITKVSPGV